MNLKLTETETESVTRSVTESIKELKAYGSMDEFAHLTSLLYVYKKLTKKNYEEVEHENENI